ncbi:GTP-binding protein [Roseibacillus persicicus]|uniref:GTP-binding protein n=1 Tax=Roseibacillus persicicus TaxID=454148 RepID=UPI001672C67D
MTPENSDDSGAVEAQFLIICGFLGPGETSSVARLVRYLQSRGLRRGVITNDQGEGLIDTQMVKQSSDAIAEIEGGCFCCRLDELVSAMERIEERQRAPKSSSLSPWQKSGREKGQPTRLNIFPRWNFEGCRRRSDFCGEMRLRRSTWLNVLAGETGGELDVLFW